MEEQDLIEIGGDPAITRDSSYMGPRKFKLKENRGLVKFFGNLFGKKEDKEKEPEKEKN